MPGKKIGIVGSGLIGRSWAMIYSSVGYDVYMYDKVAECSKKAKDLILQQLKDLQKKDLLRGKFTPEEQLKHIHVVETMEECVKDALLVQENVWEDLEMKKDIFKQLDKVVSNETIVCSSTSCFPASSFVKDLKHKNKMLVAHPVNPPYFVPLVELIPSPWTEKEVLQTTKDIMAKIGQKPVILNKEIDGFALNRIQYAILNECWHLVNDGVMNCEDVDTVMSEGLGMRYAFIGPFETAHLNAAGISEYFQKYAPGIERVTKSFGPVPKMGGKTADEISRQMLKRVSQDDLESRRQWRDRNIASLSKMKRQ